MSSFQSILLCLISFSVFGQSNSISVVPFTLENNGIYIYCKINETDSLKFLFDTGADGTVINGQSLEKLNLKIDSQTLNIGSNGSNMVDVSSSNTILFGGITATGVPLPIIPYETTQFDGVFGTNLMSKHIIEIDYDKSELRFYEISSYQNDLKSYEKFKIHYVENYPTIKSALWVNGKKYSGFFGLDTGADNTLTISPFYSVKNKFEEKMKKIGLAISQGSDGSKYESPVVLAPEIHLGNKSLYEVPIDLSQSASGVHATKEIAGFYGNSILKRFNIVLDLKNEFIYLKLNKNLYTAFY
ncbi:retropepsin-like aspartic protease [Moheibacter sediminis]|uniref:Aspartyl protease n=1 Tax=Moheibacter sediminis TaxID=1434700 RepID=A0A1W2BZY9_9FLAO|nr:retropepsin-like aspartic protease [Moheibacter sediminis]SMC78489.1 Aspartyl protease [Moheibacter sediminis]